MLNKYFKRSEFACSCGCGADVVDAELLTVLTDVREHFGKPVYITCGQRCIENNIRVGGSLRSQHLSGKAADISVKDVSPLEVFKYLDNKYPDKYGLGLYVKEKFVHVDVRAWLARW